MDEKKPKMFTEQEERPERRDRPQGGRPPMGGPQGGPPRGGPGMPFMMQPPYMGYPMVMYVPVVMTPYMPMMGGPQGGPPMGGPQGRPFMGGPQGGPPMGSPFMGDFPRGPIAEGECPKGKDLRVLPCPCNFPCQNGIRKMIQEEMNKACGESSQSTESEQ